MPPLRERRSDVPGLVSHFRSQLTGGGEPPAELLSAFSKLDWMGNVRELKNAVERAVVLGEAAPPLEPERAPMTPAELPSAAAAGRAPWRAAPTPAPRAPVTGTSPPPFELAPFDPAVPFRDAKTEAIAAWERWYMRELLTHTRGNLSQAARIVQSDRSYLRKLVRRYGLGGLTRGEPGGGGPAPADADDDPEDEGEGGLDPMPGSARDLRAPLPVRDARAARLGIGPRLPIPARPILAGVDRGPAGRTQSARPGAPPAPPPSDDPASEPSAAIDAAAPAPHPPAVAAPP
jgi:hypothetical protein